MSEQRIAPQRHRISGLTLLGSHAATRAVLRRLQMACWLTVRGHPEFEAAIRERSGGPQFLQAVANTAQSGPITDLALGLKPVPCRDEPHVPCVNPDEFVDTRMAKELLQMGFQPLGETGLVLSPRSPQK